MNNKKIIDRFKFVLNHEIYVNLAQKKFYNLKATFFDKVKQFKINVFRLDKRNKKFLKDYLNKNYYYYKNFNKNKSRFVITSYCTAAFYHKFTWDEHRITNDELKNYVTEILDEFGHTNQTVALNEPIPEPKLKENIGDNGIENKWENVFKRSDLMIWRRKLIEYNDENETNQQGVKETKAQPCIYEYKVFGRLFDVSAIDFFRTQIDLDYRKSWDHLVVKLQVLNIDKKFVNQTSELIQWIMKFPFPMNSREYIFVRRYCVEPEEGLLILLSKSIPKENISFFNDNDEEDEYTEAIISHNHKKSHENEENKLDTENLKKKSHYEQPHQQAPYVRVTKYKSNMIIVSHTKDFHEVGLDFYLNYYDDPKARIPNMAYKWMATSGLPDWLEKLHKAAKGVPKPKEKINVFEEYELVYIKEKENNLELVQTESTEMPDTADTVEIINKNAETLIEPVTKIENSEMVTVESNENILKTQTTDPEAIEKVSEESITNIVSEVEVAEKEQVVNSESSNDTKKQQILDEKKKRTAKEPHTSLLF